MDRHMIDHMRAFHASKPALRASMRQADNPSPIDGGYNWDTRSFDQPASDEPGSRPAARPVGVKAA